MRPIAGRGLATADFDHVGDIDNNRGDIHPFCTTMAETQTTDWRFC